jgi:hypothetical protein
MANDDWAVVIGIDRYPALTDLAGSENDARAFADWLSAPDGGAVPAAQIALVVSSHFPPGEPRPDAVDVALPFNRLQDFAEQSGQSSKGLAVGGRLYMYLSGHGFGLGSHETALLLANATPTRLGYNLPGQLWANWFLQSGYFREVVLFMDCSRNLVRQAPLMPPPFTVRDNPDRKARFFSAVAARLGQGTQERLIDGRSRGVFTMALLAGLHGAASDRDGKVTAQSLRTYLIDSMKDFLPESDRSNPDVSKEPDVCYFSDDDGDLIFLELPPAAIPRYTVRLQLTPESIGQPVQILGGQLEVVASVPAAESSELRFELPRGLYMARVGTTEERLFELRGTGDIVRVAF